MAPKIVAVCPEEYPGVSAVFKHGEKLGLWEYRNVRRELPKNDLVILGAWHYHYKKYLEDNQCVVYLTSTFGQMEFSYQGIEIDNLGEIERLLKEGKIKAILAGWPDVAEYFQSEKAFYCPYPFSEEYILKQTKQETKEYDSIGIFLPNSPRKNTFNQILAAINSKMKIYTNLPYDCPGIKTVGWLPNPEYYSLISKLAITLHCTFTESFSYAAAESIVLGTIPIVSSQIATNLSLTNDVICWQCDSVKNILEKIEFFKNVSAEAYQQKITILKSYLKIRNSENLDKTKNVLDEIVKLVVK